MKLKTLKKRLKGFAEVRNMESPSWKGGKVANQFIIELENAKIFQSYNSIIAIKYFPKDSYMPKIYLTDDWDYSVTTGKYRNQFLGETKKETEEKIRLGQYKILK